MSDRTEDLQEPGVDGETDGTDKRHSPRVACDIRVEYEVDGGPPHQGQLRDIGTGGVLLFAREAIPVGATLVLRFELPPNNRPIQTVGEVKWVDGKTAGVAFVGLHTWEAQEIWKYYAQEARREKDPRS